MTGNPVPGIGADLDTLFGQLDALRDLADDPGRAADSDRVYDFSIRWGTFLAGRFQRVAYYAQRGELSPDERDRYEQLCRDMRDALPRIRALGLAEPVVPDDRGPG